MIMQSTKVRLPNAPMVRPIIDISKLSVGQDFANLKTLNFRSDSNYPDWIFIFKIQDSDCGYVLLCDFSSIFKFLLLLLLVGKGFVKHHL